MKHRSLYASVSALALLLLPCQHAQAQTGPSAQRLTGPASTPAQQAQPQAENIRHSGGRLPDGAFYSIDQPARFNGTVLLWAHGYAPAALGPEVPTAPPGLKDTLLGRGYALVASGYSMPGWALAVAPNDQRGALSAYAAQFGKPRRVIAWGASMGGLVTVALAEHSNALEEAAGPDAKPSPSGAASAPAIPLDAALPVCGSVSGTLPMMNAALDGAFAFVTLAAPQAGLRLVHTEDDRANADAAQHALAAAQATPEGRARIALAATLGGMPPWTEPGSTSPTPDDDAAQEAQQASSFVRGIFLPRAGQEKLAGGNFSWNTGIDYAAQLGRSGRAAYVGHLYAAAHLRLADDLARLAAAPRIAADPQAVAYMRENYTPSGRLAVPMLSLHTLGDGLTSPALETEYAARVAAAGQTAPLKTLYVRSAGHCTFTPADYLYALAALTGFLDSGTWNAAARPADIVDAPHGEPPSMRRCFAGGVCE